ncbi:hypothetical protein GQ42DRAFT_164898 [Ramicandelaber brevisporus]|nr:hypothetical protein GQ42DRAFT_164898 [Ramicandelaber brevisporus]
MTNIPLKRRHSAVFDSSPLFRLPLELLEEISYYFTRAEAVQVLRVNSTLHEVFANRIWRHITITDQTVWEAPASAWTRYGYLVRSLVIPDELPPNTCMPNLPKLLKLEVFLGGLSHSIFEYEMPLLQQLDVKCSPKSTDYQSDGTMAAAKWIDEAESRNQNVSVNWSLRANCPHNLDWLGDMLDTVTRPEQHSVTLVAFDNLVQLSDNNTAKLAVMLVNFSYDGRLSIIEGSVSSAYNSFLTNSKHVFTKLKHLSIELTYDDGIDGDKIPKLRDTQFPAIESVEIREVRDSYVYRCGLKLDGDFSTVTKMQLTDCDNAIWSIVTHGCFPGVRDLTICRSILTLNPLMLARQFPDLDHLAIIDDCEIDLSYNGSIQSTKTVQLQYLEEFEMDFADRSNFEIRADTLQFIFYHAPNLHSVKFHAGWFACSVLDEFVENGVMNTSVRHLSMRFYDDFTQEDELDTFIELLPNLETLELSQDPCVDQDLVSHLCKRHPHIDIKAVTVNKLW